MKISLPTFCSIFFASFNFNFISYIFFFFEIFCCCWLRKYFLNCLPSAWPSCLPFWVSILSLLCLVTCDLQDNTRETKPRQWRKRFYKAGWWRLSPSLEGAKMQRAELLTNGVCAVGQRRHFIHSLNQQVTRSWLFDLSNKCASVVPKDCTRHITSGIVNKEQTLSFPVNAGWAFHLAVGKAKSH